MFGTESAAKFGSDIIQEMADRTRTTGFVCGDRPISVGEHSDIVQVAVSQMPDDDRNGLRECRRQRDLGTTNELRNLGRWHSYIVCQPHTCFDVFLGYMMADVPELLPLALAGGDGRIG